jgi:uncharacterized protein with HEPN domain
MPSRSDDRLYLAQMLDMSRKVVVRAEGLTRDRYDSDEDLRLALLHLVQIIGEAARRVSGPGRAAHPDIPWKAITGMRNKIVHDYINVDFGILYDVATKDIPALAGTLEKLDLPEDL